ncbi:hypothetical protein GmHk_02G005064 [Glycine max]|nr:hypothetical protein GmHk_02G005064 [Glycine max]
MQNTLSWRLALSALMRLSERAKRMASHKRRAMPSPGEASGWDSSRFTSEIAWHRYQDNIQLQNILPERNVELAPGMFNEFLQELQRRRWDQEFYSNLYDPEDHSPKFCRVRGQVVRFDAEAINDFLDTPVILAEGKEYPAYSQYLRTPPDRDAILSTLCTSGGRFVLNGPTHIWLGDEDGPGPGQPHFSTYQPDRPVQHFQARVSSVDHDTIHVINLAYIKKNFWNPADPSITFPGTCRTHTRASAPASEEPRPSQPFEAVVPPPASTSKSVDLHGQMLRSIHMGQ